MLAINVARYFSGIKVSGFTIIVGVLALGLGLCDLLGVELPVFPILLILVGAILLLKALTAESRS